MKNTVFLTSFHISPDKKDHVFSSLESLPKGTAIITSKFPHSNNMKGCQRGGCYGTAIYFTVYLPDCDNATEAFLLVEKLLKNNPNTEYDVCGLSASMGTMEYVVIS